MKADFPFVPFESTYVPLASVCVDGEMLAIADPRIDTGVRVSAAQLEEQIRASADGYAAAPAGQQLAAAPGDQQLAVTTTSDLGTQTVMRYPVSVHEQGFMREWTFLFDNLWPTPACPAK